ncbi:MAG: FtsX-like permease family protein [Planctomycetes bacterium]|nr:FtsX-like permease family protein [Planctomycetota bacterium]
MQYHSFLTRRYLRRRWAPWAATVAVALGVFSLISVLAVMEGFKLEMRERIRGSLSHLVVKGGALQGLVGEDQILETIRSQPGVLAASPFVETLAIYKVTRLDHCLVRGIEPVQESEVTDLGLYLLDDDEIDQLLADPYKLLPDDRPPSSAEEIDKTFSLERRRLILRWKETGEGFDEESPPQALVVGIEALRSGRLAMGDVVQLSSYSPVTFEPCTGKFMVVGAFQSGVYEQDQRWAYADIRALQEMLDLWDEEAQDMRISGVSVRLEDYSLAAVAKQQIEAEISRRMELSTIDETAIPWRPREVLTWENQRENLLQAVEIEKRIIAAMMLLIVAFAAAMIFLILMLLVIEKNRDLGVLRALGASRNGVILLVLRQGMLLCITGAILGLLGGWLLVENINHVHDTIRDLTGLQLFPPDIYYLERIPALMRWQDVALVCVPTLVFGFLGSFFPALWAGRRDPIKALHHE